MIYTEIPLNDLITLTKREESIITEAAVADCLNRVKNICEDFQLIENEFEIELIARVKITSKE